MPFDCHLPEGECIFELGLQEALKHKWLKSESCGEDVGIAAVRDWCRSHWPMFQRLTRIEHLFGIRQIVQFDPAEFGIWSGHIRLDHSNFDLVVGAFECGLENLNYFAWVELQKLPRKEVDAIFTTLDPNCVRLDAAEIIGRARTLQFAMA